MTIFITCAVYFVKKNVYIIVLTCTLGKYMIFSLPAESKLEFIIIVS